VKRVLDVVSSGVGLVVLSPVIAFVSVLVAANLGRPLLFTQERPGKGGRIFRLYKFRTMKAAEPSKGLVSDADRLTRFGRVLRATSLDELPSLVNVFRGDMSVVGPRPLLVRYLNQYSPEQARRHELRPGITGLAQVSGRNAISWKQKFELDVSYVDRRSLSVDAWIILKTIRAVVARDGISATGSATMPEFGQGSHGDTE
jgi:lipopolysaccharide/colanic/teichoic acid biosynthesis glycosyltransferase